MMYEFATYSPSSTQTALATSRAPGEHVILRMKIVQTLMKTKSATEANFLKREDEWEYMVWHTLCKPIQWMESMAGIWRRHDPLVMGLVQRLVNFGMVQAPVDPVNAQIREEEKQGKLKNVV